MANKPLKANLGVIFHPKFPPEALVDYGRRAEAAGFDELWLWEDCFNAGALTSATVLLSATQHIQVGIGLMPVTVRNPLFTAMEITTLARLYPGRFLPGFGHGLDTWMKQIGAYPKSTLKALEETVNAVRGLLRGEAVTFQGEHVHLDQVKMNLTSGIVPPLFIGAMREKTLRLAGRVGDGAILTEMSSPAYVRWAKGPIADGMAESGRKKNHLVVYVFCKVDPAGQASREISRQVIVPRLGWSGPHLKALGIADEAQALYKNHSPSEAARLLPEAWVDTLSASGTPEQAAASILRLAEAGADSVVLVPGDGDSACLDEYSRYLLPLLKG